VGRLILNNAEIWPGDGRTFPGHVLIEDGIIITVGHGPWRGIESTVDMRGAALSPGLIDLMVLGGFDRSILRDDPLDLAREYLTLGVTSCQLCTAALPWDVMTGIAENTRKARAYEGTDAAAVLGLYPEGPFQQPHLTGASQKDFALPPTPEHRERLFDEIGDTLTTINVAPGTEGDVEAVAFFRSKGVRVSMAHSDAPYERIMPCVEAGTSVLGHCWDNNSGRIGDSGVQQPTVEHVALTDDRITSIHLICDGVHVHPVLVDLILRCRGTSAICLVTDTVTRAGMPDGEYTFDDGRTFVKKGGVGRTDTGWLCGSATLLPDMLRNFIRMTGTPSHKAIRTVTLNPAVSLDMDGEIGVLAPGRRADIVAWDQSVRVRRVWRSGVEIDNVSEFGEVEL
jgi:N-acetylglucosamine-6-phosphate deacetylase